MHGKQEVQLIATWDDSETWSYTDGFVMLPSPILGEPPPIERKPDFGQPLYIPIRGAVDVNKGTVHV